MLKGFYGRFYYNYADTFSSLNPGGANYKTFKFIDLNGNRMYDGPQELGALSQLGRRHDDDGRPEHEEAIRGRIRRSVERQFWGESSIRVAYVRKQTSNEFATIEPRALRPVTPCRSPINMPDSATAATATRPGFNLMDIPDGRRRCNNVIDQHARRQLQVRHAAVRVQQAVRHGLFIQAASTTSGATSCAAAPPASANSTETLSAPSTSPLNSDPITVGYFQNVYPTVANRQKSTNWQGRAIARYVVQVRHRRGGQPPRPERLRVFADHRRDAAERRRDRGSTPRTSRTTVRTRCRSSTSASTRRSRSDKYKITGMFDAFNLTNSAAVTNFNLTNGSTRRTATTRSSPRSTRARCSSAFRFDF